MNRLYETYIRGLSKIEAYDTLKLITRHSRLQGSSDLWNAVKELEKLVRETGFDTKILKIEPGVKRGFIETPISWDPIEAWIEFKEGDRVLAKYDLLNHPTLLAAHTPGGEGCADLIICRGDECSGDAVLARGYTYDLYHSVDARLIVYYDENRHHDAFPYTGLFIKPGEERKKKTIMTIPYRMASRLINLITIRGRKVRVCWKARVKYHRKGLPVLVACRGDDPGVVFISHICHPKPGAHDNASGSTANYVALKILSRASSEYMYSSCHIWVPEYTGTVFLYDKLPWKPLGIINLDMVGSRQHITGSTMVVVNPPRFMGSRIASTLWFSISKVFDRGRSFNNVPEPSTRYSISPYSMGSDHDVYTVWGYDAVMVNEWPSKYYHTDMDDIESVDPVNIAFTGLASVIAGYLITHSDNLEFMLKTYESIVRNWYYTQAVKNDFSLNYLSRFLIKKPIVKEAPEKPYLETPIFTRRLYHVLGREKFLKFMRELRGAYTYIGVYAPLAEKLGLKDHIKHYRAELLIKWKRSEERAIRELWETVKSNLGI